ncbi:MAG: hypothetical protein ACJAUP_002242 [Cellvibrionaceae bacterium]|jgi:hypothetical protein
METGSLLFYFDLCMRPGYLGIVGKERKYFALLLEQLFHTNFSLQIKQPMRAAY